MDDLVAAMKDEDQDVRFAVAGAVGKLGKGIQKRFDALNPACWGDNCHVRIAAEEALSMLTGK